MAKKPKLTRAEVEAQLTKLKNAVIVFQSAIEEFEEVYTCETVALDYWSSGLDDTLSEIEEDIEDTFGEN